MMTPVGRLVLVRSIDKHKLVDAMAWVTMPALVGPIIGPPVGGFITTYASWHWIFLINVPIGLIGIVLAHALHRGRAGRRAGALRPAGVVLAGARRRRTGVRALGRGARARAAAGRCRLIAAGAIFMTAYVVHARRVAAPVLDFSLVRDADVPRQCGRRLAVSPGHRRAVVPAAADAAARLQLYAVRIRAADLHVGGRRLHDEDLRGAHHPPLRLPPHPDRQCADQFGFHGGLRAVHAGDAVRRHDRWCC